MVNNEALQQARAQLLDAQQKVDDMLFRDDGEATVGAALKPLCEAVAAILKSLEGNK